MTSQSDDRPLRSKLRSEHESVRNASNSQTLPAESSPQPIHMQDTENQSSDDTTVAQSEEAFSKGLRDTTSMISSSSANRPVTRPESPKFHETHHRDLPKSSEEKEREEMEYYKSHPFKALELPTLSAPTPIAKRTQTKAASDKETKDLEECKKQFHAQPLPKMYAHTSTDHRKRGKSAKVASEQEKPLSHKFRAQPLPPSTYVAPKLPATGKEPRTTDTKSGSVDRPSDPQSGYRHDAYQQHLSKHMQQEEMELKEHAQFHARPLPSSSASPLSTPRSTRSTTRNLERARKAATDKHDSSAATSFKARPMPKTTHKAPVSPRLNVAVIRNLERARMTGHDKHDTRKASSRTALRKKDTNREMPEAPSQRMRSSSQSKSSSRTSSKMINSKEHADGSSPKAPMSWSLLVLVFTVRLLNTLLIQSYFDPDEFWQTMEPAYCEAFVNDRPCAGFTWEWKRRSALPTGNFIEQSMWGPARTYVSVLPTYYFFSFVKALGLDYHWVVARGPMILNSFIVAAPVDIAVWYAARWMPDPTGNTRKTVLPAWCLFCSLVSWFNGYSLVRTFANSQETLVLVVAITLM